MDKTAVAQQAKSASFLPPVRGLLQRKCVCGNHNTVAGGECAECAKKKSGLQRKLAIGASNDPLEQEADRVADQMMAAPPHFTVSGTPPHIQRYAGQINECADTMPASVDRVISSSGRPLEPALRQDMEQRFGNDFSQVRVHTGDAAEQSARDVNANAYTVRHNIVFGAGQYLPQTSANKWLLAHELAHVVQQSGGSRMARDALIIDAPYEALEAKASGVADSLVSTRMTTSQDLRISRHNAGPETIQRQETPSPSQAEAAADVRLRSLSTRPSRAISQWKRLNQVERSFIVQVMAGRYGFDFARVFLEFANGKRKPDLSTTVSNTDDSKTLTARGFRYAGNPGGTPLWVHPSGREVVLLAGRGASGGTVPPEAEPPEPERSQAEVERCEKICDDTDDEDSCNACCDEQIPSDDPKCRVNCKVKCPAKL